ncbi:MAG: lysozyme [Parvularcula sp.]
MLRSSARGRDLIKTFEGRALRPYSDPAGHLTIGYGHTGAAARRGNRLTPAEAEALLDDDMSRIAAGLGPLIDVPLSQPMADALISLVFNIGLSAFSRSTVRRELNAGRRAEAAGAMLWWVKATVEGKKITLPGLVRRRAAEATLFLSRRPPASRRLRL